MKKEKSISFVLVLYILFSASFQNYSNIDFTNPLIQNIYGHNFTPNNYASFVAAIDQFQTESKLVEVNLVNNNISLAQKHANEAVSIFYWDLMVEIGERDKKIADDLKTSVESLQNISSLFSESPTAAAMKQQRLQQVNQFVANIDTKVDEIIRMTAAQQKADDSNFLNQFGGFISSIFLGEKNDNNSSIHPMRFAELVDSMLRNYGDAYEVDFDMTDMSNMAMMDNNSLMSKSRSSDTNSNTGSMNMMNMSSMAISADNNLSNISPLNIANYQSAQGLAEKLLEIFNNELKPLISKNDTAILSNNLESGIIQLINSIKDEVSPMDIMMIVHTQIHPNLITAFDLKLRSNG